MHTDNDNGLIFGLTTQNAVKRIQFSSKWHVFKMGCLLQRENMEQNKCQPRFPDRIRIVVFGFIFDSLSKLAVADEVPSESCPWVLFWILSAIEWNLWNHCCFFKYFPLNWMYFIWKKGRDVLAPYVPHIFKIEQNSLLWPLHLKVIHKNRKARYTRLNNAKYTPFALVALLFCLAWVKFV